MSTSVSGSVLERPADRVLDLLGRVRLVEALGEEELEEARVVPRTSSSRLYFAHPSSVSSGSSNGYVALGVARSERGPRGRCRRSRPPAPGGRRRERCPTAPPHDRPTSVARAVPVASITASASATNSSIAVRVRAGGLIRAPVAASVERHHPEVACEVRDLHLPEARVHDRPRREQQHGGLALAVELVEDPHAVAVDVALFVGVARAGLLAPHDPRELVGARGRRNL